MNLLAEDLRAEIMLTIDAQGAPRIYYSKVGTMNDLGQIAAAMVDAGMQIAAEHGITLTVGGPGGQRIAFPPPQTAAAHVVAPAPAANPFPEIQG